MGKAEGSEEAAAAAASLPSPTLPSPPPTTMPMPQPMPQPAYGYPPTIAPPSYNAVVGYPPVQLDYNQQYNQQQYPGAPADHGAYPMQPVATVQYEWVEVEPGCCQCEGLRPEAWVFIIIAFFVFWPAMFLPCCMPECYTRVRRAVPVAGYVVPSGYNTVPVVIQPPPR
eukprot:jgi/Chlat1/5741/Chrsp38S05535